MKHNKNYRSKTLLIKGFTLIEMLVVMLIIALIAGFSLSRIGDNGDRLAKEEAKRLQKIIREIREFSLYTGSVIAIDFETYNYKIALLNTNTGRWNIADAERIHKGFSQHTIANDVTMMFSQVSVDNSFDGSKLNDNLEEDVAEAESVDFNADISFSPLGDYQAFFVNFSGKKKQYQVNMNNVGATHFKICEPDC